MNITYTKFLAGCYIYGGIRTFNKLSNASVTDYHRKDSVIIKTKRPMLITERVGGSVLGALLSPLMIPLFIYKDVCDIEKRSKGLYVDFQCDGLIDAIFD
jgi:hypothetical protein